MKLSDFIKEIKRLQRKRKIPNNLGYFFEKEEFVPNKKLQNLIIKGAVEKYVSETKILDNNRQK